MGRCAFDRSAHSASQCIHRLRIRHPDCSGSTTIDTYDIRKNPTSARQTLTAGLYPNANRFNLWFH